MVKTIKKEKKTRKSLIHKLKNKRKNKRKKIYKRSIEMNKTCPSCNKMTLFVKGECIIDTYAWTYCMACKLNKTGFEKHLCNKVTGWQDVFCTIIDAHYN